MVHQKSPSITAKSGIGAEDPTSASGTNEIDNCRLDDLLKNWREEQYRVASRAIISKDPPIQKKDKILDDQYAILSSNCSFSGGSIETTLSHTGNESSVPRDNNGCKTKLHYGGVDVSFPNSEVDEPAIAVYVIMDEKGEIIYEDSISFMLEIPYVSSYLSFREIEPLEKLVRKQMKDSPLLTPYVILVDGNGILHARRAGIATFLGVRTGIKTIGIGKKLYCHDGLYHEMIMHNISSRFDEIIDKIKGPQEQQKEMGPDQKASAAKENGNVGGSNSKFLFAFDPIKVSNETLKHDKNTADATNRSTTENDNENANGDPSKCDSSFRAKMGYLASYERGIGVTDGFGFQLQGQSGTVWGAALIGHGGKILSRGKKSKTKSTVGTKNPIYVSVGHNISLLEAIQVCCMLSFARIPEPVRQADLIGRNVMREKKRNTNS